MLKIKDAYMPAVSSSYIIDCGCTSQMTFNRDVFVSYATIRSECVEMGTRDTAADVGGSDVIIEIQSGYSTVQCEMELYSVCHPLTTSCFP